MIVFPNAKINLGLNVTEKRADGYHNIETVFYPVPLTDALEIVESHSQPNDVELYTYGTPIEGNPEDNLVVKAYRLLQKDFRLPHVSIHLYKSIPSGAGLGGGSSDAAFTLKLLNELAAIKLSDEQLELYASVLGADCAFFIRNQPVFATGIGNVFTPIFCSLKGLTLALVKPTVNVSTKEAYAGIQPHAATHALSEVLQQPLGCWKALLTNDFETHILKRFPEIAQIKETFYEQGATYAAMSGSGSAVFGLFQNEPSKELISLFPNCFVYQCNL